MNAMEVNALLAKAALVDPRSRPSKPEAQADQAEEWSQRLTGIDLADALAALNQHQRESPEVVRPFHILDGVKRIVATVNQQAARQLEQVYEKPWHPAPSRDLLDRMSAAWADPVVSAALATEYRDELRAAGFDPDAGETGRAPSTDAFFRGQGKDFAIPVGDR